MLEDRKLLNDLVNQRNELDKQIKSITYNSNGVSYGSIIRKLLYDFIYQKYKNTLLKSYEEDKIYSSYEAHKIYCKLHLEITNRLGIKTQTFTRQEYLETLNYMKLNFGMDILEKYYLE